MPRVVNDMKNVEKILLATGFSGHSTRAEKRAALLCADTECRNLELLNVCDPSLIDSVMQVFNNRPVTEVADLLEQATSELKRIACNLEGQHDLQCTLNIRSGRPDREITSTVETLRPDVTVIAAGGGSGSISDLLLGKMTDKLLHLIALPLLIVRTQPEHEYRHVLVPVDFSEDSMHAARMALEIAPKADITFLHAFDFWLSGKMRRTEVSPDVIDAYRLRYAEDARQNLDKFIAALDSSPQRISRVVEFGAPVPVIVKHAQMMRPDLIVMGKHGRSPLNELLVGSVTRRTIDQTDCDVMVTTLEKPAIH